MNNEIPLIDSSITQTFPARWHSDRGALAYNALQRAAIRAFAKLPEKEQRRLVETADEWSADDVMRVAEHSVRQWDKEDRETRKANQKLRNAEGEQ